MKINFTYIVPFVEKVFPEKTKKQLNNKFSSKNHDESKTKDSVCFKEVFEQELRKVKK